MDARVTNILLMTFILSIFWESSETYHLNHNVPAKYDNRTDAVRLRRQSPVHSCKGDVLKFQCATTTDCIKAELECDGTEDCPDGSDEEESLCQNFPKECKIPTKPDHGNWINLSDDRKDDDDEDDDSSLEFYKNSVIKYSCDPGFKLSTTEEDDLLVSCLPHGEWNQPVLPICHKLCQSLYNTPLITVSCKNEDSPVRCDKATDNTIVTYKCAPHYEAPHGRPKSSTCYDGLWDYIPECIPVCGEKRASGTALVVNGKDVERGHYPWVVALYSRKDTDPFYTNICGGSLLTTDIVLTAAHCVSQKETGKIYNAKYFRVSAGKYYNLYEDSRDADTAQYADVDLIEAHRDYKGEIQNFRGDIALLKLKTSLVLSSVVQPVCYNNLPIIEPNTVGLVTGWGYTISSGEPSETLQELELPYNADEQCLEDLDKDFSNRYFTSDKLCAGFNDKNTSVCKGDSGGGLVFRNPSFKRRYFIHGIVSLAHSYRENQKTHCNIQRSALFTKVENYMEWIRLKVRYWTSITNNAKKCRVLAQPEHGRWDYLNNGSQPESNQEIDANTAIIFSCNQGYQLSDTTGNSLVTLCMPTGKWNITSLPFCQSRACAVRYPGKCEAIRECLLANEELKKNGKHALKRCDFAQLNEVACCPGPPLTGDSGNRKWKSESMCEKFYTDYNIKPFHNVTKNARASLGQFPHAAALGFRYGTDEIQWNCGATLISTRFLLTVADCFRCFMCTNPIVARLGAVNLSYPKSAQDIQIKNVIAHPQYSSSPIVNNIGIIELEKDVLTSNLVYPACLYTKFDDPTELKVLKWLHQGKKKPSTLLKYGTIQLITIKECNMAIPLNRPISKDLIDNKTQMCSFTKTCIGRPGNALQLQNENGGYDIVGIASSGVDCSGKFPEVYTRVASYLNWIEAIVWPDLHIN